MTELLKGFELPYKEDPEFVDMILERLHIAFGRSNRTGIHISDLIHCLRKAFYSRQPDYVQVLKDDSVLYFVRGRSLHDMIEKLFPNNEVTIEYEEIIGNVDAIDGPIAVEIKTTKVLRRGPYDSNRMQLRYYMAMTGKDIGYLLYYEYFSNKIRAFKFMMNAEQRERTLKELVTKRNLLIKALEINEVLIIPESDSSFDCNNCEFEQCPKHPAN